MNTPNFITLPSGLRVNTAHILEYRETEPGKTVITQNVVMKYSDGSPYMESITEDMTAAELDALLQPQGTPIVSPVLELRIPKVGEAVSFSYLDSIRHGVVSKITNGEPTFLVTISSSGETFQYWPDTGAVYLQSGDF